MGRYAFPAFNPSSGPRYLVLWDLHRVERDLHFVADEPPSVYAEVAYTRGLIIT